MKRLAALTTLALTLFASAALAPSALQAKAPIIQDACACGGYLTSRFNLGNGTCLETWYDPNNNPAYNARIVPC